MLGVGDHSPEFQIAKAPPFMYQNHDSSGTFLDLTFAQFAGYAQNLVRYYNTGGFTANGQPYVSPAYPATAVTWWGIYNEPNINNNSDAQPVRDDVQQLVPAMRRLIRRSGLPRLESADFLGQEQVWVPTFVSGVTAQVDVTGHALLFHLQPDDS